MKKDEPISTSHQALTDEALRQYCLSQLNIPIWLDRRCTDFQQQSQLSYTFKVKHDNNQIIKFNKVSEIEKPPLSSETLSSKSSIESTPKKENKAKVDNDLNNITENFTSDLIQPARSDQSTVDQSNVYQSNLDQDSLVDNELNSSLVHLNQDISNCHQCPKREHEQPRLSGRFLYKHDSAPTLVLLVESPRDIEQQNRQLILFKHMTLLQNMLKGMELNIFNVYVTDVLKCYSTNYQTADLAEYNSCFSFLKQELSLVKANHILAMGNFQFSHLLQFLNYTNDDNIISLKQLRTISTKNNNQASIDIKVNNIDTSIPIHFTFHPDFLLRHPLYKAQAQDDWLKIKNALDLLVNE